MSNYKKSDGVKNFGNQDNCVIIILGATGDLAKRKLIPAVFALVNKKFINNFALVCVAIDDTSVEEVLNSAREFLEDFDSDTWDKFCKNSYYQKLDFNNLQDFESLNVFVAELEKKNNFSGNRLVYVASMPDFFCVITKNCAKSGLIAKNKGKTPGEKTDAGSQGQNFWHRLVYEKPFGRDLKSAQEINSCIAKYFSEDQIFRVDHYLAKEIVANIAIIRFANCVFEPIWSNKYIESVDVILDEKLCLQGRGKYYDKYGAIRDVVQNHILELIALTAMESPKMLIGDFIRDERLKVLQKVEVVDGVLGQYEGYTKEKDVMINSKTETFAQLEFKISNPRWEGVKFNVRTGKCLGQKKTEIKINFKKCDCILLKDPSIRPPAQGYGGHSGRTGGQNCLSIGIYPKGTFYLCLNVKKPGDKNEIESVQMEFCHSCKFAANYTESYEVILQEVLGGERSISVRFDEIECLWKIVDQIYARDFELYGYKKGYCGPVSL